jgi:formamidopyrimidine-DNA glycosylase
MKVTRGNIKSALMKQERIAGIGNVYADEIVFQSKLHPKTQVKQLGNRDVGKFFRATKGVLKTAIESRADCAKMPRHYLLPQREKGGRCPVCGTSLKKEKISGRTTYYCPKCQV